MTNYKKISFINPKLKGKDDLINLGSKVRNVTYYVVELFDLIPSHEIDVELPGYNLKCEWNPDFPTINPKDYSKCGDNIVKLYHNLDYKLLIRPTKDQSGTPIISNDMVVVSGNNRTLSVLYGLLVTALNRKKYGDPRNLDIYNLEWIHYIRELNKYLPKIGLSGQFQQQDNIVRTKQGKDASHIYLYTDVSSGTSKEFVLPFLVRLDNDFPGYSYTELQRYNDPEEVEEIEKLNDNPQEMKDLKYKKIPETLKYFMPFHQQEVVQDNIESYQEEIERLVGIIDKMPKVYKSKKGEAKAYLRYFGGESVFLISEKDISEDQYQSYGWFMMNGDYYQAEKGYVPIIELLDIEPGIVRRGNQMFVRPGIELDFYFEPKDFDRAIKIEKAKASGDYDPSMEEEKESIENIEQPDRIEVMSEAEDDFENEIEQAEDDFEVEENIPENENKGALTGGTSWEYFLTQRPPGIGTMPFENQIGDAEETEHPYQEGRRAWIIRYSEKLTPEQVFNYELIPNFKESLIGNVYEDTFAGQRVLYKVIALVDGYKVKTQVYDQTEDKYVGTETYTYPDFYRFLHKEGAIPSNEFPDIDEEEETDQGLDFDDPNFGFSEDEVDLMESSFSEDSSKAVLDLLKSKDPEARKKGTEIIKDLNEKQRAIVEIEEEDPNTPEVFDEVVMSKIDPPDNWIGNLIKERLVLKKIYDQIKGGGEDDRVNEAYRIFLKYFDREGGDSPKIDKNGSLIEEFSIDSEKDAKERKLKIARAKAAAQKQRIRLLQLEKENE